MDFLRLHADVRESTPQQAAAEIADVLTANQIEYKIESGGSILVAQSKVAEARLKLAAQGLPQGTTKGLEMLQDDQGQVDAIVHMVAASIPMMEAAQVTVVDQFGRLLTGSEDSDMARTSKQFEYTRKLEDSYADRIIQLLQPIVGDGKVNAQVSATLDFATVESTREAYDPERSVIRSEQVNEQEMRDLNAAQGIPGALSNQPPGTGTTDPAALNQNNELAQLPASQNRSATRNFEVDRMISHTRNSSGSIQRLSVAVLVDSKTSLADDGTVSKTPYSDEEIARFESLVKETIGFDENRGDRVSVINQPFVPNEVELVEVPVWQSLMNEAWVWDLAKQILGAIGLLIVYLVFGRPFLRSLNPARVEVEHQVNEGAAEGGAEGSAAGGAGGPESIGGPTAPGQAQMMEDPNSAAALIRRSDATHEQKVDMARTLVMDDPARVANVVKNWVAEE